MSTIQNTRSALAYGSAVITWLTSRVNGAMPVVLAPAGDLPAVDVPGGQVGEGTAAFVVVLDPHRAGFARRQGGVAAAAGLDGGLLIGADDVVVAAQRLAVADC